MIPGIISARLQDLRDSRDSQVRGANLKANEDNIGIAHCVSYFVPRGAATNPVSWEVSKNCQMTRPIRYLRGAFAETRCPMGSLGGPKLSVRAPVRLGSPNRRTGSQHML